jgi:hypothetical protein
MAYEVKLPKIMPKPTQEFTIQAAFGVSRRQPTFIARPSASDANKSVIHGITKNEATKLHIDTICIFFLTSSVMFNYDSTKYIGRVQEGGG